MTTASDPNLGVVYFIHDPDSRAVKIGWSGVGAGKRLGTFWGATGQLYLILACGNERPFPGPADQYELASSWAACRTCEGATE